MASKNGELICSTAGSSGNIANADCPFQPGKEIGGLFLPKDDTFTEAETADEDAYRAALLARSTDDNPAERLFAVSQYEAWSPSGEAAQEQTFDSGLKVQTRAATLRDDMTLVRDKDYHKAVLLTLHNKQNKFDYIRVLDQGDGTYVSMGARRQDVSLNDVMGGFALSSLNISGYVYPTGSTVPTFTLQRGFTNAIDVDTNYYLVQTSFNPLEVINGLQTVNLTASSTGPTNVTVRGNITGSGSIADKFGADLAVAGAWVVENAEPGSAELGNDITISTVTQSGDNYVITIAATGTDADNPGTGGRVSVSLAAPSVLAALVTPVEGIESATAYVTLG